MIRFDAGQTAKGSVTLPPSKSLSHRALICAALSPGESFIGNPSDCDDVILTENALALMGASFRKTDRGVLVRGMPRLSDRDLQIEVGESGSSLRFLLPICLLSGGRTLFSGSPHLFSRPLSVYETLCREQGIFFDAQKTSLTVEGRLRPGQFAFPGNISSQFVSGLLFALPLLDKDSRITLLPPVESRPYPELTRKTLSAFGVVTEWEGDGKLYIPGGQMFHPSDFTVEGDADAAACLSAFGEEVNLCGLPADSLQAGANYRDLFLVLDSEHPVLSIADCPDLAPILFSIAALKNGAVFENTARLALKESSRALDMKEELEKCGAAVTVEANRVTVSKSPLHSPREPLSGHGDHRIVMALSLILSRIGGDLIGEEAVTKSFCSFFDTLSQIGIRFEKINGEECR